jgi:hypothetical protein
MNGNMVGLSEYLRDDKSFPIGISGNELGMRMRLPRALGMRQYRSGTAAKKIFPAGTVWEWE